jgi:hypothetical protein
MESVILAAHVVASILFVGPVAVTTSLFPRYAVLGDAGVAPPVAAVLYRITRVYGLLALVVPVMGLGLAALQGRLTEGWILVAMVLTAVAGGLLALRIVPAQRDALQSDLDPDGRRILGILTGAFNLLWVTVVVLMVVRPGASS